MQNILLFRRGKYEYLVNSMYIISYNRVKPLLLNRFWMVLCSTSTANKIRQYIFNQKIVTAAIINCLNHQKEQFTEQELGRIHDSKTLTF